MENRKRLADATTRSFEKLDSHTMAQEKFAGRRPDVSHEHD
jgi:hypothetical protein